MSFRSVCRVALGQDLGAGAREVVLLDNFSLGTPETVSHLEDDSRVKLVKGDILRINELYDAFKGASGVFAIAGFLTIPMSQNPPLGLAVNVEGQVNTFEACRFAGVGKVGRRLAGHVLDEGGRVLVADVSTEAVERLLDHGLVLGIDGRQRLVEHEDRRVHAGVGARRPGRAGRREGAEVLARHAPAPGHRAGDPR